MTDSSDRLLKFLEFMVEMDERTPYPTTIVPPRYGGTYEGGLDVKWLAFNAHAHDLPSAWNGDDIECMKFWDSEESKMVGRGITPSHALADLIRKLEAKKVENV